MKEVERLVAVKRQEEIDLLDLLKIIVKNKGIILLVWFSCFIIGGLSGYFKLKNENLVQERNFRVREITYSLSQSTYKINIDVEKFFSNKEFIEKLFKEKEVEGNFRNFKGSKEDYIKSIFIVKKIGDSYNIELKEKNDERITALSDAFFRSLQEFIKEFYGEILQQDLNIYEGQSVKNKDKLKAIEEEIKVLLKNNPNKNLEEIKELNPAIFSEKDAISEVYGENYKAKEIIENTIFQLNNSVIFESSLNNKVNKLSLKLIVVISNVLGIFLGVFLVFLKEFVKSINWKELKEVK